MRKHIYGPDDERIGWDPDSPSTIKIAKARWDELAAQGYEFYTEVGAVRLDEFDPSLGAVAASPTIPPPEVVEMWAMTPQGPPEASA